MVSWWDGDAISGTTALDIQDGNDGTMDGGVSTILGKVGNAFSFDGVDDFVEVPDSDSLDTGTQFTVDAWFNTNDVDKIDPGTGSSTQTIVMYGFDPADGKNNPLHIRDGKLYLAIRGYGSGFYDLMGVTSVNSNTWYHAAVTYDGTTAKLYLNGALEDSKLSSMNMNTNSRVTIGRYQNPLNLKLYFYFDGLIDEIEIFNRALPQSEIQAIYNAGSAGKCKGEVVIEVDIKPGSYPNCFNSNGHGVIPVAILGSEDFDVSTIDPSTVMLDSQAVRVKGKSGNWGSLEDVNGDGFDDLVVQILDDGVYTQGSTIGIITATSYDGATSFKGEDSICITQD
ncbi:LamG domain-containing protein, partial [bacterium]|nr:LamG domain-containing protein [bacterium]